jgi:DNA-binding XRE family transcriptional regulator
VIQPCCCSHRPLRLFTDPSRRLQQKPLTYTLCWYTVRGMSGKSKGIGPRIAELRRVAGLSQAELAKRMGYSARAIQSWEIGVRYPQLGAIEALADALGVSIASFYEEPKEKAAA